MRGPPLLEHPAVCEQCFSCLYAVSPPPQGATQGAKRLSPADGGGRRRRHRGGLRRQHRLVVDRGCSGRATDRSTSAGRSATTTAMSSGPTTRTRTPNRSCPATSTATTSKCGRSDTSSTPAVACGSRSTPRPRKAGSGGTNQAGRTVSTSFTGATRPSRVLVPLANPSGDLPPEPDCGAPIGTGATIHSETAPGPEPASADGPVGETRRLTPG